MKALNSDPTKPVFGMNEQNHICDGHANKRTHIEEVIEVNVVLNLKSQMQEMCEEMAFKHHEKSGLKIANEVMEFFIERYWDQPISLLEIFEIDGLSYKD